MATVMPQNEDSDMKNSHVRLTLLAATALSIALAGLFVTRPSRSIDGIAFVDATEVKAKLTEADLKVQDSLVANFTSLIQFNEMEADAQAELIAVANATWYKDSAVLGYSIDRRGRGGLASDAASPILLELVDGQLVFNCVNTTGSHSRQ